MTKLSKCCRSEVIGIYAADNDFPEGILMYYKCSKCNDSCEALLGITLKPAQGHAIDSTPVSCGCQCWCNGSKYDVGTMLSTQCEHCKYLLNKPVSCGKECDYVHIVEGSEVSYCCMAKLDDKRKCSCCGGDGTVQGQGVHSIKTCGTYKLVDRFRKTAQEKKLAEARDRNEKEPSWRDMHNGNSDFSNFFRFATEEEKRKVFMQVVKEANEDQRKMMRDALDDKE